jgi:hypothetical protein
MATLVAHGKFSVRSCGRVVRADAWGPWNKEQAIDYAHHLAMCITTMRRPFAMLSVWHAEPLLGPDVEAVLKQSVRERASQGCVAQATVLLDRSAAVVAEAQYRRVYHHEGLHCGIFAELTSAIGWLISRGFSDVKGLRWGETSSVQFRQFG